MSGCSLHASAMPAVPPICALLAVPSHANDCRCNGQGQSSHSVLHASHSSQLSSGFAYTHSSACPQVEPGLYDEAVFRGLDVVIAEAERAGLRVILSLADNWKRRGGVDEARCWPAQTACSWRSCVPGCPSWRRCLVAALVACSCKGVLYMCMRHSPSTHTRMPTRTPRHTNTHPLPLSAALQYVDWSETAPPRDEQFPPVVDSSGDVSTEVQPSAPGTAAVAILLAAGPCLLLLADWVACAGPRAAQPGGHQHALVLPCTVRRATRLSSGPTRTGARRCFSRTRAAATCTRTTCAQ